MTDKLKKIMTGIIDSSPLVKECERTAALHDNFSTEDLRLLTKTEISLLKKQMNFSDNWGNILVKEDFSPAFIYGNRFYGKCIFGSFSGVLVVVDNNIKLHTGIFDSMIIDTYVDSESCIYKADVISNIFIAKGAKIVACKSISGSHSNSFGNSTPITIGNEISTNTIQIFADLTYDLINYIIKKRGDKKVISLYKDIVDKYTKSVTLSFGMISENASVTNCDKISDTFIGKNSVIDNVRLIKNSTILSAPDNPVILENGVFITDSLIQQGVSIDSGAMVSKSLIFRNANIEDGAIVQKAIIGHSSKICKGEITSSFAGPLTGFHHQSLLIAAIWPGGKGNVGYGANVGSNHTGKAPDQEIFCGEGLFFGLGVNIKYPADFSEAPFTIIATGITTLPQRMTFPFSLIDQPRKSMGKNVLSGLNELFPAWVLDKNVYGIFRNQYKYRDRLKGLSDGIDHEIFRPEIVNMMISARTRLHEIKDKKNLYFDSDIKGIGKNFITDQSRLDAIETYTFFIKFYALKEFIDAANSLAEQNKSIHSLFNDNTDMPEWEFTKKILHDEGLGKLSIGDLCKLFIETQKVILFKTVANKKRDDIRGKKIIPDYTSATTQADNTDNVISRIRKETERYKNMISKIIGL